MKPPSDMIGSCVTITMVSPISDMRSRPARLGYVASEVEGRNNKNRRYDRYRCIF
jgi:hypothetical protein